MKLEFHELVQRKGVEVAAKLNELRLMQDAYRMSGVSTLHMVVNHYEGELRPVQIIGVHYEGGKVQFRAEREDAKDAAGLVFGNRESAVAARDLLAYEHRTRQFEVWRVDDWMNARIKAAFVVYDSLAKLA